MQKKEFINPFSDQFLNTWQLWKDFRKEEHGFQYKGLISEQMAIKRLVTVSDGSEEIAVRVVEQSISRGWMDFYQLKQPNYNGTKQQSATTKTGNKKGDAGSLRERVKSEFNRRYGSGGQAENGDHLKAV